MVSGQSTTSLPDDGIEHYVVGVRFQGSNAA
jgi:hypothetical protein